jgi:lipase
MSTYRSITAPVRGGALTAGVWELEAAATTTVLAVHGITASHMAWPLVAAALPQARVIAPDLRGRGGSRGLPGPWGMPQHADDLVALLDATGVERATVLAHSMGAFAAVTMVHKYPDRVNGLVLVDGGLPLPLPVGASAEELPKALLGPAAERLSKTFPDHESYREFWKAHPAFANDWSAAVEAYVDYDLVAGENGLGPASSIEAVSADSLQLAGFDGYLDLLAAIPYPVPFLRAPRGLLDQLPGLYSPDEIHAWELKFPMLQVQTVEGVNHYTIVMTERGAAAVAAAVTAVAAVPQSGGAS